MIARYRDGVVPDVDVDPVLARRLRGPRRRGRRAARPGGDHAGARPHLAARPAAEPLRRGARAVAARQGRGDAPRSSTSRCARWPRACGSSTVLLHPYIPESAGKLLAALGADDDGALDGAPRYGARARRRAGRAELAAAVPQARADPMIDSHTHLDRGPAPEAELVAAARAAGRRRILTIGMDSASCRAALAAAERHAEVFAAVGRHPNVADGYDDAVTAELRDAGRPPALPGDRRDRPRPLPRLRAARRPGARVRRPDRARARDRQAARHPHPRGRGRHDRHARRATRAGLEVILHCFSMPDRLDECLDHGWWISFAGNVTYPKAQDLAEAAERVPLDRLLVETDAPYLTPQPVRKERNQPAYVVAHRALRRRAARDRVRGARGGGGGQRRPAAGLVSEPPGAAEPAAAAGVRHPPEPRPRPELPDRLEPARRDRPRGRAAARRRRARGRRRARRALRVPRRADRARARRRARPRGSSRRCATRSTRTRTRRCTSPTRSSSTSPRCDPPPTRSSPTSPTASRRRSSCARSSSSRASTTWVAMVQREVGRALRGEARRPPPTACRRCSPSSPATCSVLRPVVALGVPSRAERRLRARRPHPPRPGAAPALRALVQQGFAHRRKTLARSLALAPAPATARPRPRRARGDRPARPTRAPSRSRPTTGASSTPGCPRERRPARRFVSMGPSATRGPGQAQPLPVRRRPARRRPAPAGVGRPAGLAGRRAAPRARRRRGRRGGLPRRRRRRTSRRARSRCSARRPAGTPRRSGCTIVKRVPVAAGMGGGSGDAAAALRLAAHAAGGAPPSCCTSSRSQLGADVPTQLEPGRVLVTGAGEHVDRLPDPAALRARDRPVGARPLDARGLRHLRPPRHRPHRRRARARGGGRALAGELPPAVNDLEAAARALCPAIDEALFPGAMVSGLRPDGVRYVRRRPRRPRGRRRRSPARSRPSRCGRLRTVRAA